MTKEEAENFMDELHMVIGKYKMSGIELTGVLETEKFYWLLKANEKAMTKRQAPPLVEGEIAKGDTKFKCIHCDMVVANISNWKEDECPQNEFQHEFKALEQSHLQGEEARVCQTCQHEEESALNEHSKCHGCADTNPFENWEPKVFEPEPTMTECSRKCREQGLSKHEVGCAIEEKARKDYETGKFDSRPNGFSPRECYEDAILV